MGITFNITTGEYEETPDDDVPASKIPLEDIELRLSENAPPRKYDAQTGCFEYKDEELRKKVKERHEQQSFSDPLKNRMEGLKKHLTRAGLGERMGKTGNSSTGEVSEQDKKVAAIQAEHAKKYILRSRRSRF